MPSTLSLSCSKKLYELLGETYETEKHHSVWRGETVLDIETGSIPAPSFSETIRLLPKIGEKAGLDGYGKESIETVSEKCMLLFQEAPTEEEGMKQVSDYLEALL